MAGLDQQIADLAGGGSFVVILAVAVLLGLRHATDPDHLTAVSTLIASDPGDGTRRAARLGLSWGAGHATTLFLFGLPIVLLKAYLPHAVQAGAELAVGLLIVALALRVLVRWRSGRFHVHAHQHGGLEHRHLHPHHAHSHEHAHDTTHELGRSPLQAYGIGLIHGAAGSAGIGILLLAGIPDRAAAVTTLVLFAAATAISMALLSSLLGWTLTRGAVVRRAFALAPALGAFSLVFGVWYALAAVGYSL
jgi:ABC-type nickel/cobalt efflux system permease component RcnA